jgi:hypothetical protein
LDLADGVGADPLLVVMFGIFHDSMRFDEHRDDGHGRRGGFLTCRLNGELLGLEEDRLDLLDLACTGHTNGRTSDDPTIGACWDADLLDLCRLGKSIDARAMSTVPGRMSAVQKRARALLTATPEWGRSSSASGACRRIDYRDHIATSSRTSRLRSRPQLKKGAPCRESDVCLG